ncbi:aldolase/citrate lyase family protein [Roseovarius autotrophicus]|uniref:aldolase/citrate lyase family protein n=1 Tax=Roseovarius autotrophicus TaxID=2824121 RepID=UPI001B38393F|nr:HpcH/HpaI aldolase/citrate lyase family protein [Roseovarius autotrophicus]
MPAPINPFKAALARGDMLYGCWAGFADAYATEVLAEAGFDWLVIDGEHAPNDLRSISAQLGVLRGATSHPVVRLPMGEVWAIKQALDVGAQTLLIPMVESAAQAEGLVRAMRYPPEGVRGSGAALARASRFSGIPDYIATANAQMCLLVQIETVAGLGALDEILDVEGVDGVFIGPSDLAADMGHRGDSAVAEVQAAIRDALSRIAASDKAAGILALDPETAARYRGWGAQFLAVGIDVVLLAQAARALAARWRDG